MQTNLHYYRYDLSNRDEVEQHKALHKKVKSESTCFTEVMDPAKDQGAINCFLKFVCALAGVIKLNPFVLYPGKWDINLKHPKPPEDEILLHDWHELQCGKIRQGYYLDITTEMQRARDETLICSRCWQTYPENKGHTFCMSCLENPNTSENELPLLFLRPVSTHDIVLSSKNIFLPKWLKDVYRLNHLPQLEPDGTVTY